MEGNNLFLRNIEIKKIKKKLKHNPEILENNLNNVKPTSPLLESEILADIIVEKTQDVKISPKRIADDGNQKTDEDLKSRRKSGLFFTGVGEREKYENLDFNRLTCNDTTFELFGFEPSLPHNASSRSSSPSISSLVFPDTKMSGQTFRGSKAKENNNFIIKQCDAELRNKTLYGNLLDTSDTCFLSNPINVKYVPQKQTTSASQHTENKICDSVEDQRYFDDGYTEAEKSKQQNQVHTPSLYGEESQIKELKENFERSTMALFNYLEALENRTLKLEKLIFEKDSWKTKSGVNTSNSKYSEENINLGRGDNVSETSFLSTSNILKGNSVAGVKAETFREAYLVDLGTRKQSAITGSCSCDCCNGGCLCFRNISRNFSSPMVAEQMAKNKIGASSPNGQYISRSDSVYQLDETKVAKKNIASNRQNFSSNFTEPNTAAKSSAATSKNSKIQFQCLEDFIRKEMTSVGDERNLSSDSSGLVQRSNAPDKLLFQNYKSTPKISHANENEKNAEYCRKRNKELKYICRGKDQREELGEDDRIIDKSETEWDPVDILIFVFLFVAAVVIFFLIAVFIFV